MRSKIYSSDDDSNENIILLCYIVFLGAGRICFNTLELITITINKKADIRTQNRDHVYPAIQTQFLRRTQEDLLLDMITIAG